jgi:hypothetical protein
MNLDMVKWLSSLSIAQAILWGVAFALIWEATTCAFRFGLDMQSTRDTAWMAPLTLGFRIHHGYLGVILIVLAALISSAPSRSALLIVGVGFVVSDLVHHFLVLWPLTGHHEFHLRYPR